jgi:hypothetical protein
MDMSLRARHAAARWSPAPCFGLYYDRSVKSPGARFAAEAHGRKWHFPTNYSARRHVDNQVINGHAELADRRSYAAEVVLL